MQQFTFTGESIAEAQEKARAAMGEDLILIETKQVRKKSLNQRALYEIVVGVEEEQAIPPANNSIQHRLDAINEKEANNKRRMRNLNAMFDDDVTIELSSAVREISQVLGKPTSMPEPSTLIAQAQATKEQRAQAYNTIPKAYKDALESSEQATPQISRAQSPSATPTTNIRERQSPKPKTFAPLDESQNLREIQYELKRLNDKVKLIQNTLWEERSPKHTGLVIPKEFAEIYRIAKGSGMNKQHLEEIMRLSLEFMPAKMREQSHTIRRYFREVLRKMIFCRKEMGVGKQIIMLVGPTGVGKTTTIAKLAARYSQMLPQKKKVGIITLDDYRIGAFDQLTWYARQMRISIDLVRESDDFLNKIEALGYCDYILIDTAGRSQHDQEKINELHKFVRDDEFNIDVTLVLSACTKYEDLQDAYKAFGTLGIDTFIFSKLDEARGLGNLFSLVYETKKPISYLSIGQEVPHDVMVANNMYLADCLIKGFIYPSHKQ